MGHNGVKGRINWIRIRYRQHSEYSRRQAPKGKRRRSKYFRHSSLTAKRASQFARGIPSRATCVYYDVLKFYYYIVIVVHNHDLVTHHHKYLIDLNARANHNVEHINQYIDDQFHGPDRRR